MVPKHTDSPDEPPRTLSPDVEARLEAAIRALTAPGADEASDPIAGALHAAGREADERKLRPEELLLIFKALEHRVGISIPEQGATKTAPTRSRIVRALLKGYYGG